MARSSESVSVYHILAALVRERRIIAAVTALGLLVGLAVAVIRRPTYTTTFSFVQQSAQDPSRAGLASLAGQFGVSLGGLAGAAQSPQLYTDLLSTRTLLAPIATDSFHVDASAARVPLWRYLGAEDESPSVRLDNTLRKLRNDVISSRVAATTTGMVTVNVRTRAPRVSFELASRLLDALNGFNVSTRQSQAGEERRFIEGRYNAAEAQLRAAEDRLERFLEGNRQLGSAPQLAMQRERFQRDVALQQQIVQSLAQQFEEARIREVRDTPVITVIERPALAARPDPQMRALIILLSAAAGLGVGVLWALARDRRARSAEDPALNDLFVEWRRFRKRGIA